MGTPDSSLFPLLAVALILWFGVFAFMFAVERRVAQLERRLSDAQRRRREETGAVR